MSISNTRVAIAEAVLAAVVSERTGMPLARASLAARPTAGEERFLTLANGGSLGIGFQLGGELIPLEAASRDSLTRGEGGPGTGTITTDDELRSELAAFLFDKLLNPILGFGPRCDMATDLRPINLVYEHALRHAAFAGSEGSHSEAFRQARDLLFTEDDSGVPHPSPALEKYDTYHASITELRQTLEREGSGGDPDPELRVLTEAKIARLEAEWIGIGRKQEIEAAFRVVREEGEDAGFEDERSALKNRFEAGRELRIDAAGQSYFRARVAPLEPLFQPVGEASAGWARVQLGKSQALDAIDTRVRAALDLSLSDIEEGLEGLESMEFEFLVCGISRDWLDDDFFHARYWRFEGENEALSDGLGGGRLPVVPSAVVFVRDVHARYRGDLLVFPATSDPGLSSGRSASLVEMSRPVLMQRDLNKKILKLASGAGLTGSARMLAAANDEMKVLHSRSALLGKRVTGMSRTMAAGESPPGGSAPGGNPRLAGLVLKPQLRAVVTGSGGRSGSGGGRKDVGLSGSIEIGRAPSIGPDDVAVSVVPDDNVHSEITIPLESSNATKLVFRMALDRRLKTGRSVQEYTLVLRAGHQELARKTIPLTGPSKEKVDWVVIEEPLTNQYTMPSLPSLFAYGISLVPPSPNPDPELDWG